MRAFDATTCDGALIIRRRSSPAIMRLLGVAGALVGSVLLFVRLSYGIERLLDTSVQVGFSLCLLPQILRDIPHQEFVIDLPRGVLLLNGKLLYPLSALESAHLDKSKYILHGGNDDSLVLWLQTTERMQIEISRQSFFGANEREIRELAHDIAEWTGLDLVLPDEFVAGKLAQTVMPENPRRFGGKRRPLPGGKGGRDAEQRRRLPGDSGF